jgi:hypothetical protein
LTNKTLTAPVIATIVNTGTLTLPTSTDVLVGRATTDTLTNKTLVDVSTFFQDDLAPTKQMQLQLANITAGATRILTINDRNGNIITANADMNVILTSVTSGQCLQFNGINWLNIDNVSNVQTFNSNGSIGASQFITSNGVTNTESSAQFILTKSTKLGNLYISLGTAPGGPNSRLFTVRADGVATTLTVTITGTATTGSNTVNFPSLAAGALISLQCINSGGANTTVIAGMNFY